MPGGTSQDVTPFSVLPDFRSRIVLRRRREGDPRNFLSVARKPKSPAAPREVIDDLQPTTTFGQERGQRVHSATTILRAYGKQGRS